MSTKIGRPSRPAPAISTQSKQTDGPKTRKTDPQPSIPEKALTEKEVQQMKGRRKMSAAFSEAAVKESLQKQSGATTSKPQLTKTTGHREDLLTGGKYTHSSIQAAGGRALPKSVETDPKNKDWKIRNELNSLVTGFLDSAKATRYHHATRTRNLDGETGIMKQGLQPRFGGSGAAEKSEAMKQQSKGKVHVTSNPGRAREYQLLFETGVMPSDPTKTAAKSPAEILKVNLTKEQKAKLEKDTDDPYQAFTTEKGIKSKYIRREQHAELGKLDHKEHGEKQKAENEALLSNLKPEFRTLFEKKFPKGEARDTALQLLKQAVRANDFKLFE